MVAALIDDEDAQLIAAGQCLIKRKLNKAMANHDWETFARGYNGPNYRENHYDERLAAAHAGFTSGPLPQVAVRQVQMLLTFVGLRPGAIDGRPGKQTNAAIVQFRQEQGLGSSTAIDATLEAALQSEVASKHV